MCEKCVIAVQWQYPNLSEEDQMDLLWSATAFPFCGPMHLAEQLIELREETDGSLNAAKAFADQQMMATIPQSTGDRK